MKFLRLLRDNWVLALVLAAVLAVLAFTPPVQSWVAQLALSQQTSVDASVDGFWAGFGKVEIHGLSLKTPGAALTVPSLEAELPLLTAAWNRRILVRHLVAKGWTLDLHDADLAKRTKEAPTESVLAAAGDPSAFARAAVVSTETAIRFFRANLGRWALPCDLSLDGIELEGDVLVAAAPGHDPTRVHVVITGGGLEAGREGAFAIDATSDLLKTEPATVALAAHGHFTVAMNSPRTLGRVGIKVDVSAFGGDYPEGFVLAEDVSADAGAGEGSFSLTLNHGGRSLLMVSAHVPDTANRLAGTWKLDLQDADLAAVMTGSHLPTFAARGEGTFDSDPTVARIHALGHLSVAASQLGLLAPPLERLGAVNLDATVDAILGGPSIRVDHLSATLAGAAPIAEARSLQAFDLDVHTGAIRPADPAGDWLALIVRKFPLAWLPASADGLTLSGADAAGEFTVQLKADGFALRSTEPLTAAGVSVHRADRIFARNLDLSALVLADSGAQGWQFQFAPLSVASGGSSLATFKGSLSLPAAPEQPVAISGIWTADLAAVAAQAVLPDVKWLGGRSASGDLKATLGDMAIWDSNLKVAWTDANDTASASVHAELDGGRLLLRVPLKVAFGSARSDLTIETTSFRDAIGDQFYLKLTGKRANLDHLKLAVARLVASGILPPPSAADVRDPVPFWGDWTGRASMLLERLDVGRQVFQYVGGVFEVKRNLVKLEEGGGKLGERHLTNTVGSLAFDPAAKVPYHVTGTATLDGVDATALFPTPASGADPVLDGRFSLAGTLTSDGINRDDLVARVRESFKITSTAGAVRFLKTDVDEAIPPERESKVGEDLGRFGSGVGSIVGLGGGIGSGRRKVSPEVQAAIDVINAVAEIGYDEASLTAAQEADGTIRLADIVMVAGDVRFTGSGQIGHVEGRTIRAQPLSVDLQLWVKGRMAKLMAAAGLLSDRKDDHGYTALKEPILLRGTMEKIDTSQWHAVMVKAAQRAPGSVKPERAATKPAP